MAKKRKKRKPKIEQVKTESEQTEPMPPPMEELGEAEMSKADLAMVKTELSETLIIEDEQPTAPVPETDELKPDLPSSAEPTVTVTCSGCKGIVDLATVMPCLICPRSLVYCPACAKAKTCHKCGKKLDPTED